MQNKVIIGAHGRQLIAGPSIVVGVIFLREPKVTPLPNYQVAQQVDLLGDYLDQLEEGVDYQVEWQPIHPHTLHRLSYEMAVSHTTAILSSRMRLMHGVKDRTLYLATPDEAWGSLRDDRVERLSGVIADWVGLLAKWYSMLQFESYYDLFGPQYEWKSNHGWATYRHLTAILHHGPCFGIHRPERLKRLAAHWLRLLEQNDFWALCQPWATASPRWWHKLYPHLSFLHWLSNEEVVRIHRSQIRYYPGEFIAWMRGEGGECISDELLHLSLKMRWDVPVREPSPRSPRLERLKRPLISNETL